MRIRAWASAPGTNGKELDMSSVSRRHFLEVVAALGLTPLPRVLLRAAESALPGADDSVLVVLQLSGGNDGLNTVVPFENDVYLRSRPSLAIRKGSALELANSGKERLGLHPSLDGLRALYDEGSVAIVPGVGYPNPNRSHFRSMDIWHTARPDVETEQGWLGRVLEERRSAGRSSDAISLAGDELPLALHGDIAVPSIQNIDFLDFLTTPRGREMQRLLRGLHQRERVGKVESLRRIAMTTVERLDGLLEARAKKTPVEYPRSDLGRRLELVGQMLAGGLGPRIYYATQGGYDTHATQADLHSLLLADLSSAVSAFWRHVVAIDASKRVTLLIFSEFGRRVRENASLGTDHGAAAPVFIVSGRVRAGFHGDYPSLTELDDGDLIYNVDFRRIYATLLDRVLGVDSTRILSERFDPLDVIV
jgi:uncharacterized protein (DUF1501 family)